MATPLFELIARLIIYNFIYFKMFIHLCILVSERVFMAFVHFTAFE